MPDRLLKGSLAHVVTLLPTRRQNLTCRHVDAAYVS